MGKAGRRGVRRPASGNRKSRREKKKWEAGG